MKWIKALIDKKADSFAQIPYQVIVMDHDARELVSGLKRFKLFWGTGHMSLC